MTWLSAIIMGLVQGIAEFLPISSSGHLAIAEHLLNMQGASEIPQFYDVLLHLGTLVAVFIAYWDEIYDMIVEFFAGVGDLVHHTTPRVVPPARRMILPFRERPRAPRRQDGKDRQAERRARGRHRAGHRALPGRLPLRHDYYHRLLCGL